LKIGYSATNESSSLSTVINLTNHTYFNLGGQASGNVYDQDLAINGNDYTPADPSQIPEPPYFVPVKGTPFNFLDGHPIGKYEYSNNLPDGTQATSSITQLQYAHGYDHNWVLNGQGKYRLDAVAEDPSTGITLWQYTDQPGVQLYTSNYVVGDLVGTTGKIYRQGQGFTLETQHYPDSPNHQGDPAWPSVVLPAGQTFKSNTAFKFGVKAPGYASSVQPAGSWRPGRAQVRPGRWRLGARPVASGGPAGGVWGPGRWRLEARPVASGGPAVPGLSGRKPRPPFAPRPPLGKRPLRAG
jgi:aldose 1-epimerase